MASFGPAIAALIMILLTPIIGLNAIHWLSFELV
jgi:hypothetical protein